MRVIVPLAGPDFENPDRTVKAETLVEGMPLLRRALESRPWWRDGSCGPQDLSFVLIDSPISRAFAERGLNPNYPGCRFIWLGQYAQGAALSALAGIASFAQDRAPIVIDLVDILFDVELDAARAFRCDLSLGGIALVFRSNNPIYSYLQTDISGFVIAAAEKNVISTQASAGTYVFRSASVYLEGIAHCLQHPETLCFNNLFYVCPVFNGVLARGLRVDVQPVHNVFDLKHT